MEVRAAQVKKPTTEEIAQLMAHAEDLVYMQFSESGAMGRAGDVILGALEDGALIAHHFNYHKWDKDDAHFTELLDQLWDFVQRKSAAVNPVLMAIAETRFREGPTFKAAFEVGNHLLINRHHPFELGEQDIFLLGDGVKTSLFLTSAPIPIFGPRLFREPPKSGR